MFAPLVTRTQQQSPGRSPADQAHLTRRSAGDRMGPSLQGRARTSDLEEVAPGASYDFTKVPISNACLPPPAPGMPTSWGAIQPKLTVGQSDDPLEAEADRVADHVLRMPLGGLATATSPPAG